MTTTSAPGKIILFGEHAVVYGRPALAVPVMQVHADVTADWVADLSTNFETNQRQKADEEEDWRARILIDAPDVGLLTTLEALRSAPSPQPLATVIEKTLSRLSSHHPDSQFGDFPSSLGKGTNSEGIRLRITSTIPVASGLGSGAAVSVAVIRALSSLFEHPLNDEQVNTIAYEVEKLHHGTPSGIDNTVITYAKPVYFSQGQPMEAFTVGAPFTIVIGDTGLSAPTKESVGAVRKLWEANPAKWEMIFDEIGKLVKQAREKIEKGEWQWLGSLMMQNHALLQELTVSSPELDRLVQAARTAGAMGAKLSGGGRGGNMIALVEKEKAPAIAEALMSAGAKRTIITTVAST